MINIFGTSTKLELNQFPSDVEEPYGIFKNGIFKKTKNSIGTFTHKVQDIKLDFGLTEDCQVAFERNEDIPKIPFGIYLSILKFYKDVYAEIKSEVYTLVIWDKSKKDFFIYVPKQTVSGATVSYKIEDSIVQNPDYLLYCDFHSHNTMNAFFSSVDTADEVAGRYFGVIGKILDERAQIVIKASFDKQAVPIDYTDLFSTDILGLYEDSDYSLNYEELKELINERPAVIPRKYPTYGGGYKNPLPNGNAAAKKSFGSGQFAAKKRNTAKDWEDYYDSIGWDDMDDLLDLDYNSGLALDYDKTLYEDTSMYDLSNGTLFSKNPKELSTLMYDFKKIFENSAKLQSTSPEDLQNIFESFSALVFYYHEVDEEILTTILEKIKDSYKEIKDTLELSKIKKVN